MAAQIKGKVQKGIGESSNTVKEQMPFFKKCFPEVTCCKAATINILLEKPLVVLSPDFTTEPLPWHPAFKMVKGGEVFKFLRIKLQIDGFEEVKAWNRSGGIQKQRNTDNGSGYAAYDHNGHHRNEQKIQQHGIDRKLKIVIQKDR